MIIRNIYPEIFFFRHSKKLETHFEPWCMPYTTVTLEKILNVENTEDWKWIGIEHRNVFIFTHCSWEEGGKCPNKEINKPLHCQHWRMHQCVKILLIVECLQWVQYGVYISPKLLHYNKEETYKVIQNPFKVTLKIIY